MNEEDGTQSLRKIIAKMTTKDEKKKKKQMESSIGFGTPKKSHLTRNLLLFLNHTEKRYTFNGDKFGAEYFLQNRTEKKCSVTKQK